MNAPQCYVVRKLPLLLWIYQRLGVIYFLHLTLKKEACFSETYLNSCQTTQHHTTANGILSVFRSFIPLFFYTGSGSMWCLCCGVFVIYQQHKGKVVPSQAMEAQGTVEVQIHSFLLSAPSRSVAGAHWTEGPVVHTVHMGLLQPRKFLAPTDNQTTDHPARSPVIILTDVRVGLLLHEVF